MPSELSTQQMSAFEQLKEQMPIDAIPGFSVATSELTPESPWVKKMQVVADDLKLNAYAYFNFTARSKGPLTRARRSPSKIISPEGFPSWVTVTYAYPPPQAFFSMATDRPVKHFVMHSFGHGWHSSYIKGDWVGWMNSSQDGRGVQVYEFEGKTVYVAKGSDPENLAHFTRFSAGLRACLNSAAQATAHFFIDRAGNLIVVGDCNDVLFTSQGVSKTSVGVEMEEAFYVLEPPTSKKPAVWKSGGKPPGTAGNIQYFAYSTQQMMTLSILCRKLETAYPDMRQRNVYTTPRSFKPADPPGYTMHDWISGSKHFDVSPHFLTQDLWDAFFALVDSHNHINPTNVWKPRQKYADSAYQQIATQPMASTPVKSLTDALLQDSKDRGLGSERAFNKANDTRSTLNEAAGKDSIKESQTVLQRAANTINSSQPLEAPPSTTFVEIGVGSDGFAAGSDDFWNVGA